MVGAGVRVLGRVDVVVDDEARQVGRPQVRHVLAVLAVAGGRWVSADAIEEDLWPDTRPRAPRSALHVIVTRARDALGRDGRDLLLSSSDAYRLDPSRCGIDLVRWEQLVGQAAASRLASDHDAALEAYDAARRLWRGDPLGGVDASQRLEQERRRLSFARTDADLAELDLLVEAGRAAPAATLASSLLGRDHLREDVTIAAVRALHLAGLRADALRAAAGYRSSLREELGLTPSPAFDAVELDVLTGAGVVARPGHAGVLGDPGAPRQLVGRDEERRIVDEVVRHGLGGNGGCVVIVGETGMGVTVLLADLVRRWRVAPDPPVVHHVRPRADGESSLRRLVGVDPLRPAESQPGEILRATEALAAHDASHGTLLVVDDVDDLDGWSGKLLSSLAAAPLPGVVLAVGRHDGDARRRCRSPLDTIEQHATVVRLDPLDVEAVLDLLRSRWPAAAPGRLQRWADHVHRWCGGNPLWIEEVLDDADPDLDPSQLAVPPSVDASVRRSLSELPVAARDLMRVAAVLGPAVDPRLLASVVDEAIEAVVLALSQTMVADVLVTDGCGHWRFRHEVVQQAIAATVAPAEAATWHAIAGRHLAAMPGRRAEAARHLALGVPLVEADVAYRAALGAAAELRAEGAYAESGVHFGNAADLAPDRDRRVEALLEQADVLERLGDSARAALLYDESVSTTAESGSTDLLVRAALGGMSHASSVGGQRDRRSRLRIAWRRVAPTDPRADVVAVELALELVNSRQVPDDELLARVRAVAANRGSPAHLLARRFLLADAEMDGRGGLAQAEELVGDALAPADVAPHVTSACLTVGIGVALAEGAWNRAEAWIDELAMLGTTSGEPRARWQSLAFRCVLLEGRGRHEEADDLATAARDLGERLEMTDAPATYALHQLGRAYRGGSLAVLAPALAVAADRYRFPVWSTLRGLAELDAGATLEASRLLRSTLRDACDDRNHLRTATLASAVLLAARLADVAALDALEPTLAESAGRFVLLGYGGPCLGPVAWYLAEAARARGRLDEAARFAALAADRCRAAGAFAWAAAMDEAGW